MGPGSPRPEWQETRPPDCRTGLPRVGRGPAVSGLAASTAYLTARRLQRSRPGPLGAPHARSDVSSGWGMTAPGDFRAAKDAARLHLAPGDPVREAMLGEPDFMDRAELDVKIRLYGRMLVQMMR